MDYVRDVARFFFPSERWHPQTNVWLKSASPAQTLQVQAARHFGEVATAVTNLVHVSVGQANSGPGLRPAFFVCLGVDRHSVGNCDTETNRAARC